MASQPAVTSSFSRAFGHLTLKATTSSFPGRPTLMECRGHSRTFRVRSSARPPSPPATRHSAQASRGPSTSGSRTPTKPRAPLSTRSRSISWRSAPNEAAQARREWSSRNSRHALTDNLWRYSPSPDDQVPGIDQGTGDSDAVDGGRDSLGEGQAVLGLTSGTFLHHSGIIHLQEV